jgi:hypothetical protein
MNSDAFFITGTTHAICQDYALSNKRDNKGDIVGEPYVIVSDGCSSAVDSDFGARLITRAARPHLYKPFDADAFIYSVMCTADVFRRTLELDIESLSATLLTVKVEDEKFKVLSFGDGIIVSITQNGCLNFKEIRFVSGAPYYLRYELEPEIKKGYVEEFGQTVEVYSYSSLSDFEKKTETIELDLAKPYFTWEFPVQEFKAVGVMSDGASAFAEMIRTGTSVSPEPVRLESIVPELTAFKGFQGQFVQRRFRKAMEAFGKKNWKNHDDLSVGIICRE